MTANPYGYHVQPATLGETLPNGHRFSDNPAVVLDANSRPVSTRYYPARDEQTTDRANAEAQAALIELLEKESQTRAAYLEPGDLVEFGGRVEIVREVRWIRGANGPTVFYDMPPVDHRMPPPSARTEAARRKWFREQPSQPARCNSVSYLDQIGFQRVSAREEQAA